LNSMSGVTALLLYVVTVLILFVATGAAIHAV
jgi:hypothetical protein